MKIKSAVFELGAVRPAQWPADGLPEFAFVGRSNVGKSSIINRLLARKSLARVSGTPGKTQQTNFYRINDQFRLVDLPGYGYASVSKTDRAQFLKMLETYLSEREPLRRVVQLVDIRHEPSKDDVAVHEWLFNLSVPLVVVATKMDKLSKSAVLKSTHIIRQSLGTPIQVMTTSSQTGAGIDALWSFLESDLGLKSEIPPTSHKHP